MPVFKGSILVIGCGSVSQCTLPLLLKLLDVSPKHITIIDELDNRARVKKILDKGVKYVQKKITKENYASILKTYLKAGDILLDLACNIQSDDLIDWCHHHNVLFLNTAVEDWDPYYDANVRDIRELTLYHRQMQLRALMAKWKEKGPTAVVDHGANPGLVSHFTKQALVDIATHILKKKKPAAARKKHLEQALENKNFPQLAYLIGVKVIHISERDTQITNKPKEVGEFVNTWSVDGFLEEGVAPAELGWGTHERTLPHGGIKHVKGPQNQICMRSKGIDTWVKSWVPSGPITGMVIRHGEAYSISNYLTVRKGDKVLYRPTVHYAYCPADVAINSLHEFEMSGFIPQKRKRILNNEIISGRDELGCLLMGHDLTSWWIGSLLDIEEARKLVPGQNATTLQVAASIVAALMYAINHPNLGLCLPDDFDHEEILKVAKPFLGPFVSKQVDWTPAYEPKTGSVEYQKKLIRKEDLWQFASFLVTAY